MNEIELRLVTQEVAPESPKTKNRKISNADSVCPTSELLDGSDKKETDCAFAAASDCPPEHLLLLSDSEISNSVFEDEFSSNDESEGSEKSQSLQRDLADWAKSANIPLISVTKLLGILQKHNMQVPAQGVTLLQTPRTVDVQNKSGV